MSDQPIGFKAQVVQCIYDLLLLYVCPISERMMMICKCVSYVIVIPWFCLPV